MLAVSLVTSTPLREDWMQFYRQQSAEMYVLVYVILTGMMLQGLTSCQNSSHTFTQNTHTHSHNILTYIHIQIIGWRSDALRMLFYVSDQGYHLAGDGRVCYINCMHD